MQKALHTIARQLGRDVSTLQFSTPSHVYNPLDYAWSGHAAYLDLVGAAPGRVLLVGMNPGPWGMTQTGVPFGDVGIVREWFGIETRLSSRLPECHPKYPILGMECHRREGSGSRLWGWARERVGTPTRFFRQFVVWNYCPLLFLDSGRNMIPEKLRKNEQVPLADACDRALAAVVEALQPEAVVGIGRYAEQRAKSVVGGQVPIAYLLHPSPASPAANRDWGGMAEKTLGTWLK